MGEWNTKHPAPNPDGKAWCTLDRLFDGKAGRWVQAQEEAMVAEMYFEAVLFGGSDNDRNEYPGVIPGREAGSMSCDLSDWNGISLEFRDYEGDPPNEAEREQLWAMGFTVIRIDYKDRESWTSQHKFHGDWSCVKGEEPFEGKPMRVGVDRCPRHYYGNGPDGQPAKGQCGRLFGHDGGCEHGDDAERGAHVRL